MSKPPEPSSHDTLSSDKPHPVGVMLLHGLTGTPTEMKPVAKHLGKLGFFVSTPVLAGHGKGHKELLKVTWKDWINGVQQDLDELKVLCDEVYVVGLSMGCLLSVLLAANNPDVNGITLLSTDLGIPSKGHTPLRYLMPLLWRIPVLKDNLYWVEKPPYGLKDERMQRQITKAIEAAKKGESGEFGLFRTYIGSFYQRNCLIKQAKQVASQVKCPVQIVHSLEDTMLSPENAKQIHDRLGSADKAMVFIEGCDHVMTVDLKRNAVAQLVGEFILSHSKTAANLLPPQSEKAQAQA